MDDAWFKKATTFAPVDDENYVVSFDVAARNDWKAFLQRFGFVVLHDVLSAERCERTVASFWNAMNERAKQTQNNNNNNHIPNAENDIPNAELRSDDWRTWETDRWPTKSKFLSDVSAVTQEAFDNRTDPKLYDIFRAIFDGEHRLWCNVDAWGIFRGTVFEEEERADWRYELPPHWDVDPWRYVEEVRENFFFL